MRIHLFSLEEYSFTPLPLAQVNPANPNATANSAITISSCRSAIWCMELFAGLGDVNAGSINTTDLIDRFFFSATDVPEPAGLSSILSEVAG
jgi:hypothetical protein